MNRRERRALERQGKQPKSEPVYSMKFSDIRASMQNGIGKELMMQEIHRQCLEADKGFTLDMDTLYLWTLHSKYGWGAKRLKQFYLDVFAEHMRMRQCYEVDDMYPERYKLKEKGIDLEAWYQALFDDQGNFRNPDEVSL